MNRDRRDPPTSHADPGTDLGWASVIQVRGPVTADEAIGLQKDLHRQIDDEQPSHVVLDLSDVTAMDTAGAAVLIEIIHDGIKNQRRTLLCSPSASVIKVFEIAGLENVLDYSCRDPEETRQVLLEDAPAP